MRIKEEKDKFEVLSQYHQAYLEPAELYILRQIPFLEKGARLLKQRSFNILSFLTFFDEYTFMILLYNYLIPKTISEFCTPEWENARKSDAILGCDHIQNVIVGFFKDLERLGIIKLHKPVTPKEWDELKIMLKKTVGYFSPSERLDPEFAPGTADCNVDVEFIQTGIAKTKRWLDTYLDFYMNGGLPLLFFKCERNIHYKKFFPYNIARDFFKNIFFEEYQTHKNTTILITMELLAQHKSPLGPEGLHDPSFPDFAYSRLFDEPQIRPLETIFAMEKEGILKIEDMHPNRILVELKELPKLPRSEPENDSTIAKDVSAKPKNILTWKDLEFNRETGDAIYGKVKASFTPDLGEFKLLKALMEAQGERLSYEKIGELIWSKPGQKKRLEKPRNISFYVRNIRQKLNMGKKNGQNKDLIQGKGVNGYRLI